MAPRYRSLHDPAVSSYLDDITTAPNQPLPSPAQAGAQAHDAALQSAVATASKVKFTTPRAQSLARGVIGDTAREAEYQQRERARAEEQTARENERAQAAMAKAEADAAEANRAMNVRAGAAAGMKTETDIATGKRSIATHPDGAPVWKAGPQGEPMEIGQQSSAIQVPGEAAPTTRPFVNPLMGDDGGATGATGGTTQAAFAQPVRDDRGNISMVQPDTTTDAKTGRQYTSKTDPTTGATVKTAVGIDQAKYDQIQRDKQYQAKAQEIALQDNAIKQQRLRFDPAFKPVATEFEAANKEIEALPPVYTKQGGIWTYTDPKTLKEVTTYDPREVERQKTLRDNAEKRHARAKEAYDKMAPNAGRLDSIEKSIRESKLRLDSDKLRMDAGLPEDDGGVAELLAGEALGAMPPAAAKVAETTGTLEPMGPPRPILTPDTDEEAVRSAYGALRGIEGITARKETFRSQYDGKEGSLTVLERDGKRIATVSDGDFAPTITLTREGREDAQIRDLANLGTTGGAPLYLQRGANRKSITQEAAEVADIFTAVKDPALYDEQGKPLPALTARMEEIGATPQAIMRRVDSGDLSVQHGAAILKDLYGTTMEATDPNDPEVFKAWVAEKTQAADQRLRDLYGKPTLTDSKSPGKRLEQAGGAIKDFGAMDQVRQDFLVDQWQQNAGKPGVKRSDYVRMHREANAKAGAPAAQIVGSWLGSIGNIVKNDVAGSMVGLATGLSVQGGAGMIAWTGDAEAKAKADEFMRLRNRSFANFTDGFARNMVKWGTPTGRQAMKGFDQALSDFQQTIDAELDKPMAERDQTRIQAAKQGMAKAAKALHDLAPDEKWPMGEKDFDPDKDPVLMEALARYAATADPRVMGEFKARLLMNNGGRQLAAEMAKKVRSDGFWGAVEGGTYAGWQEIGTELLADAAMLFTAGGSKAVQGALKAAGAVGKAKRIERTGQAIGKFLEKWETVGIRPDSLAAPLTGLQKVGNTATQIGKTAIQAGAGEGMEELIVEMGADDPDLVHAALVGALGGVALTPAFYPVQRAIRAGQERTEARTLESRNIDFAKRYNDSMSGVEGFTPITPETAATARNFIDARGFDARTRQVAKVMADINRMDESTPETKAVKAQLAETFRSLSAELTAESTRETEKSIAAAQEIDAITDPARKTFMRGVAKVVGGNTNLLTQAERSSLQRATTEAGAPYFATVNGMDYVTDEARAEIAMNAPAVGALIQTTESQALIEAQSSQPITPPVDASGAQGDPATGGVVPPLVSDASGQGVQPTTGTAAPLSPAGLQQRPSDELDGEVVRLKEIVRQNVTDPAGQENAQLAQTALDNVRTEIARRKSDPSFVEPSAPAPAGAPNLAGMDAAQYETARAENPAMPEIGQAVADAVAQGRPVSVSMAKAAGIETPEGYTRRGATLVPPDSTPNSTPNSTPTPAPIVLGQSVNVSMDDGSTGTGTVVGMSIDGSAQVDTGGGQVIERSAAQITPASSAAPAATPVPIGDTGQAPATPEQSVAAQVQAAVEEKMPAVKGRLAISNDDVGSGGADIDIESGNIRLSLPDIKRAIKRAKGDTAAVVEYLTNIVERHEVVHLVQTEQVKAEWEAAQAKGYTGTFLDFYEKFYTELAKELLTPEAINAARKIYGKNTATGEWYFDSIKTEWQQAAEFTRMLVEAKIDGNTGQFSELFRVVKTQGAKSKLAKIIRAAIKALTGMTLTPAVEQHIAALKELYAELSAKETTENTGPQNGQNQGQEQGQEAAQYQQPQGKEADKTPDKTPDQDDAILTAPMRATGDAISAALTRFPKLAGKLKAELRAIEDEIIDALEALPPAERISYAEKAIANKINEIADREAERTGKKREEVIESFRAVAGKQAAKQAASIEAAVIGTEAPAIPSGRQEQRDTPNSEMTVDVTSTFVDLDQLIGSSDPLFPGGALQPRNRSTQASRNQREEMVQNIRDKEDQHRRYMEGATTDSGRMVIAPLFGADGKQMTNEAGKPLFYVISGNGRRNALAEANARKVSGKIEKGFRDAAASEGIDTEGMGLPVPVSVFVPSSAKEAIDLAEYSNRDAQLSVSNTEQANRDAASIEKANLLPLWEPDASGDAAAASNRGFVKAFARAVGDEGIIDGRSELTEEGAKRIERAMVAMLLGPDQSALLDMLFNRSGTLGLRAMIGGVASEAGSLLKLAAVKPDFDLSPVLATALRAAVEAKQSLAGGEIRDVGEWFDQGNLFESSEMTPDRQLARALVESRSRKAIVEILGAYRRGAQAVDTSTMSMFDEGETTREDVILKALEARPIEQVVAEVEAEFGKNADLSAKLRIVIPAIRKLPLPQRKAMNAAIGAEVERLRDGVVSAPEWQRLNPDALSPMEAMFQRVLDSHTPQTLPAGMFKMLSRDGQAALASSPAPARDPDPRLAEEFGENFEADEYGLPKAPRVLPSGDERLDDTLGKETVTMERNHPLVVGGFIQEGSAPRSALRKAIIDYFISKATPLADSQQQTVFASGGGGGAGKTTILNKMEEEGQIDTSFAVLVNADEIKLLIPEFIELKELGEGRAAAVVHEESSKIATKLMDRLLSQRKRPRYDIIFDATLGHAETSMKKFQRWREVGAYIHLIGITIDPREAMIRAVIRGKNSGRWVPTAILAKAHHGFNLSVMEHVAFADRATIYDNTPPKAEIIGEKKTINTQFNVANQSGFENIKLRENEFNRSSYRWTDQGQGTGQNRLGTSDRDQQGRGQTPLRSPRPESPSNDRSNEGGSPGESSRLGSSPSPAYVRLTRGDKGNDPITPTTSQVEWAERNPKSAEKLRAIIDAQAKAKGYAPAKYLHGTPGKNPALAKDAYDKNKNGLGLYEGTGEGDFTEFLREKTKEGMGLHFFTQSQIWAENFTGIEETNNNSEDGYRIIPAYLKIRNPWSVDSAEHRALIPELANERAKVLTGGFGWLSIEKPEVVERIKSLGFDAIMMRERDPGGWFDDFETVAVFESSQAKDSSLVNFEAGKMIAPAARFDESKPSILYSSPAPQLDLFGGFEAQLTGPRAKAKVNAAEMLRNAPAKAKPQIAKSIAKREGLEDLDLFAAAAVRSLDAKPRRGETTINASGSGQLGFDFDSGTPAGQQADTAGRTRGIRADQATPSRPGRSGEQAGATAGEGAASDVQGADSGRGGSGDGSAATDTRDGRGGRAEAGNRQGGGQDGGSGSPEAGKRKLVERERPPVGSPERNFTIGKDTVLAEGGTVTRLRNNLAAIDLLRTLEKEGRNAAVEEKAVLAKYVGWGGIPQVFDEMMFRKVETGEAATRRDTAKNYERYGTQYAKLVTDYRQQADTIDKWNEKWGDHYRKLKELLSPEEWTSAQESTINAHYTSPKVITAMWDAVKRLGYLGGNILEPAGGVGHYFGLMPPSIAKRSQLFGVELDSISGRIFGKLYPESQIEVTGFQDSTIPDNSQSLVISNVPFANINISDAYLDAQPDAPKFNLHNYFFEKALRVAQPGGLIAFITTSHTMDSQIAQRKWLAERADFLGAIRLPNNAFKENANTQVVTDIIFLRKPDGTPNPVSESWKATTEVPVEGGKVAINEYFARHPEMILGRLANDGSMYAGREEMTVHGNGDLADQLREAIARLPENVVGDMESAVIERLSRENAAAKDGAFIEENGKLVIKGTGEVVEAKQAARVRSFITLRDTLNSLYLMESDPDATDAEISRKRAELNRTYDTFRVVHKELHNPVNKKVLSTDPDFYRTLGLEAPQKSADGKTVTFTKADVFTKRILEPRVEPTSAESIEDAMIQSLRWKGRLDTKFVGKLMNLTMEQAESNLLSLPNVFRNPATGMLEQSTGYLAGNVRRKLRDAELAAQTNPDYNRNVEELRAVMPADVDWADIQYKIGSTWIPAEVYQDFIREKLMNGTGYPEVIYNKGVGEIIGDSFVVNQPASYRHAVDEQWGVMTKGGGVEKSAFWVAEKVLNQEDPRINRTVDKKQVYDAEATETARAAAERMADAFIEWVDANPDLQDRLHKIYNESFNSHVIPKYDGSFMQLPWVAKDFDLYPSKKHVVWRALQEGSMLVAHGVGGGKTIIGTAVAMEVRRLGLAKKPMIVVHNATLEQFATTITQMAPTARVLVARKEDLAGGKRKEFMGRIRSGDWDAVVMAHSTFDLIPDDPAWERQQINELLEELDDAIRAEGADPNETEIRKIKEPSVKELVKMRKRLKDKISKLQDRKTDDVLTFQELGIDTVIVDEAHRYKKMPFVTRQSNIAGIDTGSSQRGTAMHLRSKWIQAQNGGRGVYTMTGTPVTNTLGESWNMIRLVRPDLLKEFAVQTFDRFVSVFGNIKQSGELRPNGQYKPVTRLAEFTNIPEWNRFWGLAADVKMGDDMDVKGRPKIKGGKPALTAVERTPQVAAVIAEITKVIDRYDKMTGKEKRENNHVPLLTYAAARMAAIDVRLVNPEAADDPGSKVNAAIANVMRIYKDTGDNKGTQVIFSDSYRPLKTTKLDLSAAEFEQKANDAGSEAESEEGFNLYHDIREKLVKAGVPRSEIAIIGEAKNDKQREMMFEKVNTGEIRIIMGSTETLGTGVNMQKRMFAAHHLDVPWTPAGLEQRDGRVFRQGNMWAGIGTGEIEIMRYGMKDTLDAALWQKLETKERMIKQAVSGEVNARVIEDDAGLLNYMEQKAALSGADGMLKFELDDAVRQFKNQFRTHRNRDYDLKKAMIRAQAQIDAAERNLPELRQAAELVAPLRDVDAQEVGWSIEGGEELKGEKARKALDEIFKARRKKAGTIANAETAPSLRESIRATANGVPVVFRVASISEDLANVANPDLRWQIAWQAYFPGYESASSPASPHPGSNLSAVPALVRNIAAAPDSMERAAAQARKDIENFKSESGKPFPKLAEFRKTLIDQAALYDRMGISRPEGDDLYQNVIGEGWQEKLKGGDKTARAETPANYPGAGLAPRNNALMSSPSPQAVRSYLDNNGTRPEDATRESERVSSALAPNRPERLAEDGSAYSQGDLFPSGQPKAPPQGQQIADAGSRALARAKVKPGRNALSDDLIRGMAGDWAALAREIESKGRASSIIADLITREIPLWNVNGSVISGPSDIHALMLPIRSPYFESLKIMVLDGNNEVSHSQILTVGTLTEVTANPAEIFGVLARLRETSGKKHNRIIFSHNHPSGNPSPSSADDRITMMLEELADMAGWSVLDHVITNGETFVSFRELGRIGGTTLKERTYTPRKIGGKEVAAIRPEDRQAPWEAVPRSVLRDISAPDRIAEVAKHLRNANPDAAHIFYTNTQQQLLAVERIDKKELTDKQALTRRILAARGREGAHSFALDVPHSLNNAALVELVEDITKKTGIRHTDSLSLLADGTGYWSASAQRLMEDSGNYRTSPTQETDLFTASRTPDAGKKLGGVTVGRMNALAAYRSLTGKREKGIKLTAKEEQQLLDAEVALGQKLAFDMEALKTKAAPPDMRPSIKRSTSGMDYRQMEMSRYGETDRAGQMTLLSSPAQRGVDYAVTKSILEGSYERTEADESAGRAFRRAVRQDKDLGAEFAGTVPEIVEQRDSDQLFGYRLGAAILSELSGKGVLIYDPEVESASGGVTVPRIPSQVFVTKEHPSIPAGAGHEAWHRLQIDHPYDAALIGAQILEQVPSGLMDAAEIPYARNYPANRRTHEIAANIFSSIVTDPLFWRIYGTPNSDAIASELEKANVPQYREAKLVRDWPELVRSVARVLRREDPTSLFSSPASFYSPLERAVEAKIPARATPEQIMATVKAAGVKAEEIKWSGIEQALGNLAVDGKVPKDALLAYLRDEGAVRFEEVVAGDKVKSRYEAVRFSEIPESRREMVPGYLDAEENDWVLLDTGTPSYLIGEPDIETPEGALDLMDSWMQQDEGQSLSATKFGQHTLPGGKNYREVVLAMPDEGLSIYNATSGKTIKAGFQTFGAAQEYARKEGIKDYNIEPRQSDYQSSHFPDVPNYVAHMRTNERDGGLFIEELQSDRHQAGRKQGYKGEVDVVATIDKLTREQAIRIIKLNERGNDTLEGDENVEDLRATVRDYLDNEGQDETGETFRFLKNLAGTDGVPDAPFRTTWPLALFKRALRDAVAGGKTWIGWTVGKTQSDRFDLSKHVDKIEVSQKTEWDSELKLIQIEYKSQGNESITTDSSGKIVGGSSQFLGKPLDEVIGKELAQNILDSKPGFRKPITFAGDDLKVGGSGMKGFYDNMLPKEIGKYVKQWGATVAKSTIGQSISNEDLDMGDLSDATDEELAELEANGKVDGGSVPIWRIAITPAMREGVNGGQALFSSPAPEDSAAVDAALASMRPIYRAVFEAVNSGMTPEQVMAKYSLNEKAVANILNAVRSRIATAMSAAADPSLSPAMREGKFDGGRPDLALSTIPEVAAVDQIRNESDVSGTESWADVVAEAESRLRADYAGEYDRMLALAKNQKQMDTLEVAITKLIIARETMEGRAATKEERVKLAMLIHGYREVGTETARSLAIRRDPHKSPAERHAQFIAEALFTPDEATRKTMRNASPGQQADILASWMARVDAIKAELRNRGLDLDASLAAFNKKNEARKQAEADSPRVKAAMDEAIRKLTKREKAVVEAIRGGALASQAMQITGFSKEEIQGIWTQFVADYRANMKAAALRFMATTLASSPAGNYLQQLEAEMGIFDWDVIDDTKKDFVDRREQIRNPKPAKPRKTSTPKPEKTKAEEMIGTPDKPLTPKQIAAIERFINAPPSTWRTLWQTEMKNLRPLFGQMPFDNFNSEYLAPWKTAWQEELGLWGLTPTDGFAEWYDKSKAGQRVTSGELFPQDINETTGGWDETRPFTGQGQLIREAINETTGTFDLNDPAAMKEVINAFAFARGTKMDALMEFWRMSILTGPQTHLVNMGSNALYAAYNLLPRRAVEAAANTALSAIGLGSQEAATFAEFSAMAKNLRSAIQLGARQALTSWRLETRTFEAYAEGETLQLEFAGVGGETFAPKLGGKIGKIMRSLSFRAMTAADEFMKHTYGQMEAAAQAHRIAKAEEKLTGAAYEARITELMKPGSKAWIRAMDSAKRITFQEDLDGTGIRAINRIDQLAELAKTGRAMPWIGRPLTFFLPFINTPTNIAKQAIEMSPLGGAVAVIDGLRALRRKVARGKMSKAEADAEAAQIYDRARLVKDVTNQTIAWTMYFAISGLVKPDDDDEDGRPVITGTQPYKTTKRGERDNAYAVMPPQSIRIGDVVFSYSRIEPFASMMAGCVDLLQEIERNNGTLNGAAASAYLMRLKDQAKDKTFLQGVSDILNAIEDPDRFAERASSNILTGFIPNIIRQPIREMDSKIRDSNPREDEGFFPAMARRVGYSIVPQLAPVKQDVWGNDIVANRGKDLLGLPAADSLKRALDPLNSSIGAVSAPIDAWIFRYNNVTADSSDRIGLTPIPSHVTATVDGKRVKLPLTVEEQREANRNAGQAARAMLGEDWDWRTATEAGAKDMADRITDTVREFQSNERERLRQKKLAEMRGME